MPQNKKLDTFLRQSLMLAREEEGVGETYCIKIVLKHVNAQAKQNEVHTFDTRPVIGVPAEKKEHFVENLISEIEDKAQDDAESYGGSQRYMVFAYYRGIPKALGRCGFQVDASDSDDSDDEVSATEPATGRGLLAQMMRHNEALMRTSVGQSNHMMTLMRQMNDNLQNQNGALLKSQFDTFELVQTLQSQKHMRDLETRNQEFAMGMKEDVMKKLMLIAPSIINGMAGKKLLQEPTNPAMMTLQALAKSFQADQLEALASSGILRQEQLIAIVQLLKSAMPEEPDASEEKPVNGTNGSNTDAH